MRTLIYSLVLVLGAATTGIASADEDVSLEELPAPVRETVDREVGSGIILEIERDYERDRSVYEVEYRLDGVKYELDVAEDGTLLRRHRD
jgi:uncharacterized membrane protein YkoI